MSAGKSRIQVPAFSVLLISAVVALVGICCLSAIKVQYVPSKAGKSITVAYAYPDASARIVENDVTSRLEGLLAEIRECVDVSSVSSEGGGHVTMTLKPEADLQKVRFDVASRIRNAWTSLPQGCSYPAISVNSRGEKAQTAISYGIRSSLPTSQIASFAENSLRHPLSLIEGVSDVEIHGWTPFETVVTFDYDACRALGITAPRIRQAILDYYGERDLGMLPVGNASYAVKLKNDTSSGLEGIPVASVGGRIVKLSDIASIGQRESAPESYYRVNGLNVLNLAVSVSSEANIIRATDAIKDKMASLCASLPEEMEVSVSYDGSEYVRSELSKVFVRTALCLLILLLFALAFNRSWRYMLVIALTLGINVLVALALYYLLDLHVHIYTLAGVTVSLGIIIDNAILMIDHYSRHRDRGVFPELFCAVSTTAVTLLAIYMLPQQERANLSDFALVIAINLVVSLFVSAFFVPALLDFFPLGVSRGRSRRRLRRRSRLYEGYARYIRWGQSHRWVLLVLLVAALGIPTCLLPSKSDNTIVDAIVSWEPYARNRNAVDKAVGGSFAMFHNAMSRSDFYREPERQSLNIEASMPQGCTLEQMNLVIRQMEKFLSSIDGIDVFETRITSYDNASIRVYFKPEHDGTFYPLKIKSDIIAMAADLGGASWRVSGIDESFFNNNLSSSYAEHAIDLSGYSYDDLVDYGDSLVAHLLKNRRVEFAELRSSRYAARPRMEYAMDYDFEALAAQGIGPSEYFGALYSPLYSDDVARIPCGGSCTPLRLESSVRDEMDLWHIENVPLPVGDRSVRLSDVGKVESSFSGVDIYKKGQTYSLSVCFNAVGSTTQAGRIVGEALEYMNGTVLPLGFKAEDADGRGLFYESQDTYFGLIALVIALIFVLCAIHFNSLRLPLSIILLIPVSFIGLFLAFGLSGFVFDKGGFAAFVMLCALTVNAGIYMTSAWLRDGGKKTARAYLRSFRPKIWPVSLTILSSVLSLMPFLFNGPDEVFWFSFAVGTMSGLVFSVIGLLLFFPAFLFREKRKA